MTIKEKASYLKGLINGLELDEDSKESKLFSAIVDLLDDMASSVSDLEYQVDDIIDQIDDIDCSLSGLDDSEDEHCCHGDTCECECENFEDDCDVFYEVECPSCKEIICPSEQCIADKKMNCPKCGELLEFDGIDDGCHCGGHDCHCD